MAGEDRFPPHLSPFAKVITEVGSGAWAGIAAVAAEGDQLGCCAIDSAEIAEALAQDALGGGDQEPVRSRRAGKEGIQRAGEVGRRCWRRLDGIAERPYAACVR